MHPNNKQESLAAYRDEWRTSGLSVANAFVKLTPAAARGGQTACRQRAVQWMKRKRDGHTRAPWKCNLREGDVRVISCMCSLLCANSSIFFRGDFISDDCFWLIVCAYAGYEYNYRIFYALFDASHACITEIGHKSSSILPVVMGALH